MSKTSHLRPRDAHWKKRFGAHFRGPPGAPGATSKLLLGAFEIVGAGSWAGRALVTSGRIGHRRAEQAGRRAGRRAGRQVALLETFLKLREAPSGPRADSRGPSANPTRGPRDWPKRDLKRSPESDITNASNYRRPWGPPGTLLEPCWGPSRSPLWASSKPDQALQRTAIAKERGKMGISKEEKETERPQFSENGRLRKRGAGEGGKRARGPKTTPRMRSGRGASMGHSWVRPMGGFGLRVCIAHSMRSGRLWGPRSDIPHLPRKSSRGRQTKIHVEDKAMFPSVKGFTYKHTRRTHPCGKRTNKSM